MAKRSGVGSPLTEIDDNEANADNEVNAEDGKQMEAAPARVTK